MNHQKMILLLTIVLVFLVLGGGVLTGSADFFLDTGDRIMQKHGVEESSGMRLEDLAPGVRKQISQQLCRSQYEISRCEKTLASGKRSVYRAENRIQNLSAYFTEQGIQVCPEDGSEEVWHVEMSLSGYGYGKALEPIKRPGKGKIAVSGGRVEYRREQLTEWYVNDERGLEQGVTLLEPPGCKRGEQLTVEWRVTSTLVAQVEKEGKGISFSPTGGEPVLRYSGLKAWDVTGRSLPAKLEVREKTGEGSPYRIAYVVDDTRATYPVMIDPVFTQATKILPGDGAAGDYFGYSVSISGDTVVVGAHLDDDSGSDSGSAYIYYRNQGGADNWGQVTKITSSDGAADDNFGWSVAINGDTVVVGAYGDDDNGSESGSAYIYYRNQGGTDNWGQVTKIAASDGAGGDHFGRAVHINGDTVVAGAWQDDDNGLDSGSAYIFYRDEGGTDNWGQVIKKIASDGEQYDYFGYSISVSGDTLVVGAWGDDDKASSAGAAYIFYRDGRVPDTWGQVTKITASDGAASNFFGYSVSISNDTVVVGASGDDGSDVSSGSAYIYYRNQGGPDTWGQVTRIISHDGIGYAEFGRTVSISDDTVVVGDCWDDDNGFRSGSAYIYYRNQGGPDTWGQAMKITADDGAANDNFGYSVSISGDTAVVGSWRDADSGFDSGSAYIYGPTSAPVYGTGIQITSLYSDIIETVTVGDTVTFTVTALAAPGMAPLNYRFYTRKGYELIADQANPWGGNSWSLAQGWTVNNSASILFPEAGFYFMAVHVSEDTTWSPDEGDPQTGIVIEVLSVQ